MYGLAVLKFNDEPLGYVAKGSFDWGGTKPEATPIEAEQVSEPIEYLPQNNGRINPKFDLIQFKYENLAKVLGGVATATNWKAPKKAFVLTGKLTIDTVSGQRIEIGKGMLLATIAGPLSLTATSKIECEIKLVQPDTDAEPYSISDISTGGTPSEG